MSWLKRDRLQYEFLPAAEEIVETPAVGAQPPELAADRSLGRGLDVLQNGQGAVADVVDDADGEAADCCTWRAVS